MSLAIMISRWIRSISRSLMAGQAAQHGNKGKFAQAMFSR
jgi:hypothetical protein